MLTAKSTPCSVGRRCSLAHPHRQLSASCAPRAVRGVVCRQVNRKGLPELQAIVSETTVEVKEVTVETKQEGLLEINQHNFYEYLGQAGDALVVVDFFTDWCGPCKMIYPELVILNEQLGSKAHIVKFNCNKQNKELGVKLGIKVAPTFHIYRNSEKLAEFTGAKLDKLKALIDQHL